MQTCQTCIPLTALSVHRVGNITNNAFPVCTRGSRTGAEGAVTCIMHATTCGFRHKGAVVAFQTTFKVVVLDSNYCFAGGGGFSLLSLLAT